MMIILHSTVHHWHFAGEFNCGADRIGEMKGSPLKGHLDRILATIA
jgi:hypothetical protein